VKLIRILAFVLVMAASAFAANVKQYSDGPTGVTVTLNDAGAIKSMVASGESKLTSGDAKDVLTATQKAALQAKAKISVCISVSLSSNEVMDDLSNIASKTTAPGITTTSSSATRQALEAQRKIIRNNSDAILNGLIIVKTETNKANKNVKVVLSTDDKLMLGAVVPAAGVPTSKPASVAPDAEKKK
jgi:hypothetical protein